MSGDEITATLTSLPHAASAIMGVGPLADVLSSATHEFGLFPLSGTGFSTRPGSDTSRDAKARHQPDLQRPDLQRMAAAIGHTYAIRIALEMLNPAELNLAVLLAAFDGSLETAALGRELEPLEPKLQGDLIDALVVRLLARRDGNGVTLRPGVAAYLRAPGRHLDRLLVDQGVTSDVIANQLRRHGVAPIPPKKSERIEAVRTIVESLPNVLDAVAKMTAPARAAFTGLLDAGPNGVSLGRIGVSYWHLRSHSPVDATNPVVGLRELNDFGLIWIDDATHVVGLWLEIHVATRGRVFADWPLPKLPQVVALTPTTEQLPSVLTTLENLLRLAAAEPLQGLKTGGVGVKVTKDLAKRLGISVNRVSLLVPMAIHLGLIEELAKWVRSGRSGAWSYVYRTHAAAAAEWSHLDPVNRWASLVATWSEAHTTSDDGGPEAILRRQALADLLALAPGTALAENTFVQWFTHNHVMVVTEDAELVLADLIALDLVSASGPTGLTTLTRALISDPASAAALLPATVSTFVVQADLTIVAPLALDPSLRARLDRMCSVESEGSVVVFRLDPTRIAAELASNETAESLTAFLAAGSSVPLASSVGQMIRDAERKRGGLHITAATTVVTADDVLGLAEAVKVKSAKLILIAPTVAVSDLPLAKVLAALRTKGLAPTSVADTSHDNDFERDPWRSSAKPQPVSLIHPSPERIAEVVAHATK